MERDKNATDLHLSKYNFSDKYIHIKYNLINLIELYVICK